MNKERKVIIAAAAAAVLGLAALAVRGYLCTRVATIVNDEAVWDLRDSSPSMKVILLRDGAVARFVSESDSTYVGDIQDSFEVPKTEADVESGTLSILSEKYGNPPPCLSQFGL